MRTNANGDYMYMGVVEQSGPGMISDYPTIGMWGMYDKPYDAGMGYWQTEVFISLRRSNHQLVYTTMFGSHFDHIPNPGDEEYFDFIYQQRGCDFGHDLLWADGEVLYLVGTSGGFQYDRQCPTILPPTGPGLSYCELSGGPLEGAVDSYDGMIARFDLEEINIGMAEQSSSNELLIFPNPSADVLRISTPAALAANATVSIIDALGREVLSVPFMRNTPIAVSHLATGAYTLRLTDRANGEQYTASFIRH